MKRADASDFLDFLSAAGTTNFLKELIVIGSLSTKVRIRKNANKGREVFGIASRSGRKDRPTEKMNVYSFRMGDLARERTTERNQPRELTSLLRGNVEKNKARDLRQTSRSVVPEVLT